MRTTVTLDPDVESALHRVMQERGVSFKQALNDAVRTGTAQSAPPAKRTWTRVRDLGVRADVDLDRALTLAGELEDAEILRKMRSGR